MAENSKIEWTTHTFNPWRGCSKVHTGCANCYAESQAKRNPGTLGLWGPNGSRVKASDAMWREPVKWNEQAGKAGVRHRVFCASMADVFEDWRGPILSHKGQRLSHLQGACEIVATMDDLRRDLFALIDETPHLDWLLLTKRPQNIRKMWPACNCYRREDYDERHLPDCPAKTRDNVWLGTSVSDQDTADEAIPELLKCRDLSPVLFLSAEPLVGPVNLTRIPTGGWAYGKVDVMSGYLCGDEPDETRDWEADPNGWIRKPAGEWERGQFGIDWVIIGGESGHHARPCDIQWIRDIRDQCQASGVPCFIKQLGKRPVSKDVPVQVAVDDFIDLPEVAVSDSKGGDWDEWPDDLRVREFPLVEVKAESEAT